MENKEQLDHNIMAIDGVKDREYVELFGVPKALANTSEINNWLINDTYEKNLELEYTQAIKRGRSEQEARNLLKEVKQKRGY